MRFFFFFLKKKSESLKGILPILISKHQSAFIVGCQIVDASPIANKVTDDWTIKRNKGIVIKLNIEKAFDTVDWIFLDSILMARGFVVNGEAGLWVVFLHLIF